MKKQLQDFITQELVFIEDGQALQAGDDLFDLGLDSMGVMRLVLFIEEQLNIRVPDQEVTPENLQNIDSLLAWLSHYEVA